MEKDKREEYGDFFDAQVVRMKNLGVPNDMLQEFRNMKNEIIDRAIGIKINTPYFIPFLLVVPIWLLLKSNSLKLLKDYYSKEFRNVEFVKDAKKKLANDKREHELYVIYDIINFSAMNEYDENEIIDIHNSKISEGNRKSLSGSCKVAFVWQHKIIAQYCKKYYNADCHGIELLPIIKPWDNQTPYWWVATKSGEITDGFGMYGCECLIKVCKRHDFKSVGLCMLPISIVL